MRSRLIYLVSREKEGLLNAEERQELNEYERIEYLTVMIKAGSLPIQKQAI